MLKNLSAALVNMRATVSKAVQQMSAPRVVEGVRVPKPDRFSRWLHEVGPGRWRSIWRGTDNYRYCSGAGEAKRRRVRIIADKVPANQVLGSYFEARDLALRLEFPKTHRFAA